MAFWTLSLDVRCRSSCCNQLSTYLKDTACVASVIVSKAMTHSSLQFTRWGVQASVKCARIGTTICVICWRGVCELCVPARKSTQKLSYLEIGRASWRERGCPYV